MRNLYIDPNISVILWYLLPLYMQIYHYVQLEISNSLYFLTPDKANVINSPGLKMTTEALFRV